MKRLSLLFFFSLYKKSPGRPSEGLSAGQQCHFQNVRFLNEQYACRLLAENYRLADVLYFL
jgi:hypothetical protein